MYNEEIDNSNVSQTWSLTGVNYTAEIFNSAIVAVGSFNPAIFTPEWLEKHNLIGSDDADVARESDRFVVSHQVTLIETGWFSLQVVDDQLALTGKGVLSPALRDLAVGIFLLLPHTPVKAIGLNFFGHYKITTQDAYYRFGDVFAPKDIWKDLFPDENESAGLLNLAIVVENHKRGDAARNGDQKRISIQPSSMIKYFGIHLSYNDHREAATVGSDGGSADWVCGVIESNWDDSWSDSQRVFSGLINKSLGE